ncbi:MAG: flagellar hook-basal body complex protein FliE [Planctomycetota bacterium]|nr:MAG: flagellar hook-basal body complex protein FliE [Planctomycetota bacterium]
MSEPIQFPSSPRPVGRIEGGVQPGGAVPAKGKDFRQMLLESLEEVNRLQTEAETSVQRLLTGETDNVAEVLHAVNKAGIAFDLLMEVRNKLTDAYREIQQMRI